MLQLLEDLSAFHWIEAGRQPIAQEPYAGVRVRNCMPTVFQSYCKLFHPIYIDPRIEDRAISWHEAESENRNYVGVLSGGTLVRQSSGEESKGARVRWSELAQRYGLTFHKEINDQSFTNTFRGRSWPRYLLGPDEGMLDQETCEALLSILSEEDPAASAYFYFSELSVVYDAATGYSPRLYSGAMIDVHEIRVLAEVVGTSPEYWWPVGKEWCVCTDYDLTFTLIGGPPRIIDAVINHPQLEAVGVLPDDRVDCRADYVNEHLWSAS